MTTVIKICGITNLEDAMHAVNCGAEALGFNFFDRSPRFIDPAAAADIIRQLPPHVLTFGVFVNAPVNRVLEIAGESRIKWLQLHGDEGPSFVAMLRAATNLSIMKALRVDHEFTPARAMSFYVDAVLLDAYTPGSYGGTGHVFDWAVAAKVNRSVPQLYLAGGLSGSNVEQAIRSVRPFAVDACSALENSPGRKDPQKVRTFIERVREVEV